MNLDAIDPRAVAEAMLARGFAQLLALDALDDEPITIRACPPATANARSRTAGCAER